MAANKRVLFKDQLPGETLTCFLDRVVRPDTEAIKEFKGDVNELGEFLKQNAPFAGHTVAEVFKSGSVGKGTAVRGRSDIDLVVYFDDIPTVKDLKEKREQLLKHLRESVESYKPWKGKVEVIKETRYFLKLRYGEHEVDLVPACNIYRNIGTNPMHIFNFMEPPEKRAVHSRNGRKRRNRAANEYSVSLAKLQVQFIKGQPSQVKDACRLLKYWRDEYAPDFRSYCLELIVVNEWKKGECKTATELFQKCLERIADSPNLAIAFDENYDPKEFIKDRNLPYILDPANPFMNTLAAMKSAQARRRACCHCNKYF